MARSRNHRDVQEICDLLIMKSNEIDNQLDTVTEHSHQLKSTNEKLVEELRSVRIKDQEKLGKVSRCYIQYDAFNGE